MAAIYFQKGAWFRLNAAEHPLISQKQKQFSDDDNIPRNQRLIESPQKLNFNQI